MNNIGNTESNINTIHKLRSITPLKFIKEEDSIGLLRSSKMIKYEPNEVIIKEGQISSWIYFLIQGRVGIQKDGETISFLDKCGDIFGEMCIIDNSPRSASIVAVSDTICLAIDTSYSKNLRENDRNAFNAVLYRIFSEILVQRLRKMDEELIKVKNDNYRLIAELEMAKTAQS